MVHRLRAEKALGKPLPPRAIVHHADGSRDENAPLVICQDIAYHCLLHARMRVRAASGNPNTDKVCRGCTQVKHYAQFHSSGSPRGLFGKQNICKDCVRIQNAKRRGGVVARDGVPAGVTPEELAAWRVKWA